MKVKIIRFTIAAYLLSAAILFLSDETKLPSFYHQNYMAAISLFSAFLAVLPKIIFRSSEIQKQEVLRRFQALISISLLIGGAGGLGLYQLYKYGFEYDKFAHLIVPFILTAGFADFFYAWYSASYYKALATGSILVMIGGLGWEAYEFLLDWSIGTLTLGQYGKFIPEDTIIDIAMNTAGIIAAITFIFIKNKIRHIEHRSEKD